MNIKGVQLHFLGLYQSKCREKYIDYIMGIKGSGSGGGWVKSGGFKAVINGKTVYSTSTDSRINCTMERLLHLER